MYFTIISVTILLKVYYLYRRHFPVKGIECIKLDKIVKTNNAYILDIRDYELAHHHQIKGTINIPLAYLKRNYRGLNEKNVYIIASNIVDVNISSRFLLRKGIKINGFYLIHHPNKKSNIQNCKNRRVIHGVHG
ncbi:hypothetical protein BKP45_14030 [Anaerobacillus alkalidiazotrophicus]|uniref:Rhodanese domain-containing protein n=1 Tax=Anaerobacillus alkalidiazotrophicus TaxID=472963 RepID=A0A1S2M434_9BACI|nr:hypothetical protein [Anaerobacillus alkalidiazotrophicus]OIJ19270.1 hypothetical protein BKP45_14030 [Anaerobacillus alkalidiazotrophicus]